MKLVGLLLVAAACRGPVGPDRSPGARAAIGNEPDRGTTGSIDGYVLAAGTPVLTGEGRQLRVVIDGNREVIVGIVYPRSPTSTADPKIVLIGTDGSWRELLTIPLHDPVAAVVRQRVYLEHTDDHGFLAIGIGEDERVRSITTWRLRWDPVARSFVAGPPDTEMRGIPQPEASL